MRRVPMPNSSHSSCVNSIVWVSACASFLLASLLPFLGGLAPTFFHFNPDAAKSVCARAEAARAACLVGGGCPCGSTTVQVCSPRTIVGAASGAESVAANSPFCAYPLSCVGGASGCESCLQELNGSRPRAGTGCAGAGCAGGGASAGGGDLGGCGSCRSDDSGAEDARGSTTAARRAA